MDPNPRWIAGLAFSFLNVHPICPNFIPLQPAGSNGNHSSFSFSPRDECREEGAGPSREVRGQVVGPPAQGQRDRSPQAVAGPLLLYALPSPPIVCGVCVLLHVCGVCGECRSSLIVCRVVCRVIAGLWHADKLIVQAEVSTNIASLMHSAGTVEAGMRYLAAGLWTIQQRWQTVDKYRVDKFLSLLRHLLRQALLLLARHQWRADDIALFAQPMQRFALGRDSTGDLKALPLCPGIALHFADIFLDELQLVRTHRTPHTHRTHTAHMAHAWRTRRLRRRPGR